MSYTRQTNFTRFTNRNVPDESREIERKAKALDKQRIETVNNYKGASSDQINEMNRLSGLQKMADDFELQNLKQFTDNFAKAVTTSAQVLGKDLIERRKEKGAQARQEDEARLVELEQEIAEAKKDTQLKLSVIDLENEKKTLTDKINLADSRKRLGAFGYGYTRDYLQSRSEGFLSYLLNETRESTDIFKAGIGEEGDADYVPPVLIKDYNKLSLAEKQQVHAFIQQKYINESNIDGVSPKIREKYLDRHLDKITNTWFTKQVTIAEQEIAYQEISDSNDDVARVVKEYNAATFTKDTTDDNIAFSQLEKAIQIQLETNKDSFARTGQVGTYTAGQLANNNIYSNLVQNISLIDNDAVRGVLIEKLKNAKFVVPSKGTNKATLEEHFPSKYNFKEIEKDINKKISENREVKRRTRKENAEAEMFELKQFLFNNPKELDTYLLRKEEIQRKFGDITEIKVKLKDLDEYPTRLNDGISTQKSEEYYDSIKDLWPRGIPKSLASNFHPEHWALLKQQGRVANDLTYFETNSQDVKKDHVRLSKKLELIFLKNNPSTNNLNKDNTTLTKLKSDILKIHIPMQMNLVAAEGIPDGEKDPELYMYKEAVRRVDALIETARDTNIPGKNPFAINSKNEFINEESVGNKEEINLLKQVNQIAKNKTELNLSIREKMANNNTAATTTNIYEGSKLSKEEIIGKLNPTPIDGKYSIFPESISFAAKEDMTGKTVLDIWNHQRSYYQLPPITKEQLTVPTQQALNVVETLDQTTINLLKSDNAKDFATGIDKSGLVSTHLVATAAGDFDVPQGFVTSELGKLDGVTLDDYNAETEDGEELRANIKMAYINTQIAKASIGSNNKLEVLHRVHALLKNKNMNDWRKDIYLEQSGVNFVNNYYSGGYSGDKYSHAIDIQGDVKVERRLGEGSKYIRNVKQEQDLKKKEEEENSFTNDEDLYNYRTQDLTAISVGQIEDKLEDWLGEEPDKFGGNKNQVTPEWADWNQKKQRLESQIRVLNAIEQGDASFGLRASQKTDATVQDARVLIPAFPRLPAWIKDGRLNHDIVNVISQERFDELKAKAVKKMQAKGFPNASAPDAFGMAFTVSPIKGRMEEVFTEEFYKLLIAEPEFFTGEAY